MKLKELPFVVRAFQEIEADNSGMYAAPILVEREVPKAWRNRFLTTEGILMAASMRKVPKRVPERAGGVEPRGCFRPGTDTLADMIVTACNDSSEWALKRLGCSDKVAAMVQDVLGEFFDGALTGKFTGPRPDPFKGVGK